VPKFDDGTTPTVPLESVLASLKRGFPQALSKDTQGYAGLSGAKTEVILAVNQIKARRRARGLAGLPLFQAAATISPSFSLSNDNNQTYNTTINFAKAA
jgi:hypothetical protein